MQSKRCDLQLHRLRYAERPRIALGLSEFINFEDEDTYRAGKKTHGRGKYRLDFVGSIFKVCDARFSGLFRITEVTSGF